MPDMRSPQVSPGQGNVKGIVFVLCATVAFSVNDLVFKLFSGTYPLHQMILIRSLVALFLCAVVIVPISGGVSTLRTRRPHLHILRGVFVVSSNIALYSALAVLPIADAIAIFYSAPLMITGLSVALLGAKVGLNRWLAIGLGMSGVLLVVQPGFAEFRWETLIAVFSALTYAMIQIMTRWMGMTERAVTLFFYNQVVFVVFSLCIGLAVGDGKFANPDAPLVDFLFRAWTTPPLLDLAILVLLGALSASGGYLMTLAYRDSPSHVVAPFEYLALLMAVIWGVVIWQTLPNRIAMLGILLIVMSGLWIAWREAKLSINAPKRHREP